MVLNKGIGESFHYSRRMSSKSIGIFFSMILFFPLRPQLGQRPDFPTIAASQRSHQCNPRFAIMDRSRFVKADIDELFCIM